MDIQGDKFLLFPYFPEKVLTVTMFSYLKDGLFLHY